MKKMPLLAVLLIAAVVTAAIIDRSKTVKRKTTQGWVKIIDENGDGVADVKLTPVAFHPFGAYSKSQTSAEDKAYFSKN